MMTPDQRKERGERAASLLASDMFQAAARDVDAHYRDAVFATRLADTEKREALFAEYSGFRRMMTTLQAWKADGALATREIAVNDPGQ